jgi:hypothetical protein
MGILDTVKIMIGMAAPNSDGAFTAPAAAMPRDLEAQHHQALAEAAREALRTAHVERASAAAALDAAEAKVARALEVIATSQRLDSEAGAAEAAAREAARIWTAAGCPEDARPDASLLDAAAAASNAAVDARTVAAGARDALPVLQRTAQSARIELEQSQGRVRDAAVGVLAAAAEPRLAQLERLREEYEETLRPLAALRHLLRRWGPGSAFSGFSNSDAGIALEKRIKELTPLPPADPDVNGAAADLRDRAVKLLDDAGATLDV